MSKQKYELTLMDAFAGSGWRRTGVSRSKPATGDLFNPSSASDQALGFALRALSMKRHFHRYVFGDLSAKNIRSLRAAVAGQLEKIRRSRLDGWAPEVRVEERDANALLSEECDRLSRMPMARAVAFLDPFGMQVDWQTLTRVAGTAKVDLWMLFPIGIGVSRMLPHHGEIAPGWRDRLNRFFGDDAWEGEVYNIRHQEGLFGQTAQRSRVSHDELAKVALGRLRRLFGDGLLEQTLPLEIRGRSAYELVFACSSRSSRAKAIAHDIAGHILAKAGRA